LRDEPTQFTVTIMDRSESAGKDAGEARVAAHVAALAPGLEALQLPATVLGRDLRYLYVNAAYEAHSGRPSADFIGRRPDDVFRLVPTDERRGTLERALRGEAAILDRITLEGPRAGRWVRAHYLPLNADGGDVIGVLVVLVDVQQIKDAEATLAERERQLSLFIDSVGFPITYVDRAHVIRFANRPSVEWSARTPETMIGLPIASVAPPEVMAAALPLIDRALAGEVVTYEREAMWPGRETRRIRGTMIPDKDRDGKVLGVLIVLLDIENDHRLRKSLEAKEAELRLYTENIPDSVAYLDRERRFLFANRHFAEQRGVSPDKVVGHTTAEILGAETAAWIAERTQKVLDRGEIVTYERLATFPNGEQHWYHVKAVPHLDPSGAVIGMCVVGHDVSELKSAQALLEDKERQLRQVIDSLPSPMCYVDADGLYRYVNNAFLEYIGLAAEQIVGHHVREVLGEQRYALLAPNLERLRAGESLAVERLVRFADGRQRWLTVRLTPRISEGRYLGYYATTSDIHEQKTVEQELRRAHSILSAHIDNTPLAVIEWDTQLRIARWSGQAEAIFGWTAAETLGRAFNGWRHIYEDDAPAAVRAMQGLAEGRERHTTLLHRNYRKDGSVIWVEWHSSALRDETGRVISILSLAQDVSSRIQAEERLQYMATHDGLTGLPNTVLLNDRLGAALARARRAFGRVAVMFLDLDHFKDVNDTLGHRVGDGLLQELARRIRGMLRQSDVLARISGDEFVIVLEDLPDEGSPQHVARKILDEVRRAFQVESHEIQVSGSLGLALYPEDGGDAETLLKNADAAMYHAKEMGRNSFRLFSSELAARRAHRLEVETALRRALKNGELLLHFQPIVDVATGEVRKAEALIRWLDPQRGLMLPHGFIPLAEESGLGQAIGHWVLDAACRRARAWRDARLGDITVCVNLSAGQLRDSSMLPDLKRVLHDTECSAGWLQFEITETSMVRDVEGVSQVLAALRGLGVRVAIDDFGTGFSSLSHLRHLPVDALKIDKGFVADIGQSGARARDASGGAAIASAVIGLARGLGLEVIAEGVEKRAQYDFLAREGCSACQGYLICPPVPADEFERWLKTRQRSGKKKRNTEYTEKNRSTRSLSKAKTKAKTKAK
jgi:diguanylate cyclase (GGDEF)-like protein/PAS domain S-box-containing protein